MIIPAILVYAFVVLYHPYLIHSTINFVMTACTVDCGIPIFNGNVNVSYSSTLENSTLTFQCNTPNSTFIGIICQADGTWSIDRSGHIICGNLNSGKSYDNVVFFTNY